MEAVQPRQRKRTTVMRLCSRMAESCRTSPQTGLVTSILAVGLGSKPALRGDWKWSRRVGENMGRVSQWGGVVSRERKRESPKERKGLHRGHGEHREVEELR